MKKLFIATCLLLPGLVYSAATPLPSGFDARMQTVSYNGANTTVIRSKTGFLTSVVFDEGEAVISAKAGFPAGWEITTDDNVVYINPRPVVQEQEGDEGEKLKKVFQPTEKEWDTNLFVRTTKRIYSLDLILLSEEKQAQPAYVVQFRYPSEIAKKNAEEVRLAKEKQEKLRQKKLNVSR